MRACMCELIILYVQSKVPFVRICFPVKFMYVYAISLHVKDMTVRVHVQTKCVQMLMAFAWNSEVDAD